MAFGKRRAAVIAATTVLLTAGIGYAQLRHSAAQARGVDFSQDEAANYAASQLAQRLLTDLPGSPGYAGVRIVSYGIEVSDVGSPTPEMRALVDRDSRRYQGNEIPVRFRSVRYSEKELQAVVNQLRADWDEWKEAGLHLSSYGIDVGADKVMIDLLHYTDGARDKLLARYGDRVAVTPHDVEWTND